MITYQQVVERDRIQYTRTPARYAKNTIAIQCPSNDSWKSRAAWLLESIAPKSIRWSNRESAYMVSKRTADLFEAKVKELEAQS